MLLFDHAITECPSLQNHSFNIINDYGKRISKQAIDKRFNNNAVKFINAIFKYYLEDQINSDPIPSQLKDQFSSIRIMDSTEFKLPSSLASSFPSYGGSGTNAGAQIQFEYDMLNGKIENLSLENVLVSDHTYASNNMGSMKANSLVIRDLGYFNIPAYKEIEDKNSFYISRLKPILNIYEKSEGKYKRLTHTSIIRKLRRSNSSYLDLDVFIGQAAKYPVRLVANLLEEKTRDNRLKKLKARRKNLTPLDKIASHLNLFVTNIDRKKTSSNEIYQLYKLRWQVELVFKTWKSILKIHKVRQMKPERLRCYLMSKLLWILISWDIHVCFSKSIFKAKNKPLSMYKSFGLIKQQAYVFKKIIHKPIDEMKQWMRMLYEALSNYCLKEDRKGRLLLIDLLKIKIA